MHKWLLAGLGVVAILGLLYLLALAFKHATMRPPASPAHVIFGGDMMFDRTIRTTAEARGGDYLFSCLDATFARTDLVVANLEGPITVASSTSLGTEPGSPANFVFTFPPSTAALLAGHHVGLVNLGNNHILNQGSAGVVSTTDYLRAAGVGYFGDPLAHTVAERVVGDVPLAFINYNEFDPSGGAEASTTLRQISEEKARGFLPIIYTHWGIEYATTSPGYIVAQAHAFVDAGAVMVIGSHPHVVEQKEVYKGVPIYYSLGNLIFDQYFSAAVEHGLLLEVTFDRVGVVSIKEIPVALGPDRRTCPAQ